MRDFLTVARCICSVGSGAALVVPSGGDLYQCSHRRDKRCGIASLVWSKQESRDRVLNPSLEDLEPGDILMAYFGKNPEVV